MPTKIKIARVVTIPIVFTHILNLLDYLSTDERFEVHIICGRGDFLDELKNRYPTIIFHNIEIPRDINFLQDVRALLQLTLLFFRENFDIVHSHTPKAGVTSALAAFVTRTPIRIHTFTGQVWATLKGPKKALLIFLDRMIGFLNTHIYADSFGQKKVLLEHKIRKESNLSVLHHGSFGGINIERFNPMRLEKDIEKLRSELFSGFTGKILIYLGRLNPEKGITELSEAFFILKKKYPLKLLIVGPMDNTGSKKFSETIDYLKVDKDVKFINFTSVPEHYLGVGDILCFPSYREGFGTVALEAAAMTKPVVASNIYGLSDAVINNQTGLLFEPKNTKDLILKLEMLLSDEAFAKKLGRQGRERTVRDFSETILTQKMIEEYLFFVKKVHTKRTS